MCLLPLAGCSPGKGSLKGTVSLKGKLLAMGSVNAMNAEGLASGGEIQPDGTYLIAECPGGKVKVCVISVNPEIKAAEAAIANTPEQSYSDEQRAQRLKDFGGGNANASTPTPAAPPPKPGDASAWMEIPVQYSNPDTSGLEVDVSGVTVFDINMT